MVVFRPQLLNSILDRLKTVTLTAGIVLLAFSFTLGAVGRFRFALVAFFTSSGLLIYRYTQTHDRMRLTVDIDPRVTTTVFLFLFSLSFLYAFYVNQNPFRHPAFFGVLTMMVLLAGVEIYSIGDRWWGVAVILSKLTLTSALYRSSIYPNIVYTNGDVYAHMFRAYAISEAGHISAMPGYSDMPLFHIFWATLGGLTGIGVVKSTVLIAAIPALGVAIYYAAGQAFDLNRQTALFSALFFVVFTILNRTKVQTEAFVVAFFVPMIAYLVLKRDDSKSTRGVFLLILVGLLALHFYYAALAVAWVGILFVSAHLLRGEQERAVRSHMTVLFSLTSVMLLLRMLNSDRLYWPVGFVERFLALARFSDSVSPSFLTPKVSRIQFFSLHLTEFLVFMLAIVGVLIIFGSRNRFRVGMVTVSFILFSVLTAVGIALASGSGSIGHVFRNAYFLSPFMLLFAALGTGAVFTSIPRRRVAVAVLCCLLVTTAVFGLGSQQGNKFDPVFHSGDVPSPKLTTVESVETYQTFTALVPEGSVVVGDTASIQPLEALTSSYVSTSDAYVGAADRVSILRYSDPSLSNVAGYNYLITNEYTLERGMTFDGTTRGLKYNRTQLSEYTGNDNRIWDSGKVEIYQRGNRN